MLALGLQGLGSQNGSAQNGGGVRKPYIPAVPKTPEVKIRDLPFYPVKATLLRPTPLVVKDSAEQQQQSLSFYLSPEQAITVNNGRKVESNGMVVYKMHILLRFTKPSPDNVQDDDFPRNLCLKVNNKVGKYLFIVKPASHNPTSLINGQSIAFAARLCFFEEGFLSKSSSTGRKRKEEEGFLLESSSTERHIVSAAGCRSSLQDSDFHPEILLFSPKGCSDCTGSLVH